MNPFRSRPLALLVVLTSLLVSPLTAAAATAPTAAKTTVTIEGEKFFINGMPTYAGRTWKGKNIEGLMMNSRMVQGVFDDLNPATRDRWAYPDTGRWDADRREVVKRALAELDRARHADRGRVGDPEQAVLPAHDDDLAEGLRLGVGMRDGQGGSGDEQGQQTHEREVGATSGMTSK